MVGIGKGVIRTLKVDVELVGDLIPVDLAVNLMIAAAWSKATTNRFVFSLSPSWHFMPIYSCLSFFLRE